MVFEDYYDEFFNGRRSLEDPYRKVTISKEKYKKLVDIAEKHEMLLKKLDQVESIRVLWFEDTGETIGFGQLAHWAHIAMGKVPQFLNGKWVNIKALTDREVVSYPSPLGSVPLYYVGHPEPVTLPRYIETNEAICKGGILPESDILLTKILDKLIPVKHKKIMK